MQGWRAPWTGTMGTADFCASGEAQASHGTRVRHPWGTAAASLHNGSRSSNLGSDTGQGKGGKQALVPNGISCPFMPTRHSVARGRRDPVPPLQQNSWSQTPAAGVNRNPVLVPGGCKPAWSWSGGVHWLPRRRRGKRKQHRSGMPSSPQTSGTQAPRTEARLQQLGLQSQRPNSLPLGCHQSHLQLPLFTLILSG